MPILLLLFLIFLVIPALEISVFIAVGGAIGIVPTLLITIATAVIGTALMRSQGFTLIQKIQKETDAGRVPGEDLGHGAMILMAGLLLLIPGFVTDAIGLLLFVPPIRHALWQFFVKRMNVTIVQPGARPGRHGAQDGVVDLDENEWSQKPHNPDTPWNKDATKPSGDRIEDKRE